MKKMTTSTYGERMFAQGISVSNNTRETGLNNNDLIIGGTGSGKTGGYIFQSLLNPHGSLIVSDTKGQLCRMFGDYLRCKGYQVRVLDFVRPEKSIAYNPLSYIGYDKRKGYKEKDIKKLATIIMPKLDSKDPFWERAASRYIAMLIGYVLEALPKSEHTMRSVVTLHEQFMGGKGRKLLQSWAHIHPEKFSSRKYTEMSESYNAEKMWLSIMEFANEALDPFSYVEYDAIFAHAKGVDIEELGKTKTVLFVNSSDNDTSFHVLSNLFYTQALQNLLLAADNKENGSLDVPVRMILDDFAASPKIEDFDNIISVIRSRNISVSIIIQSISQLWSKYSKDMGSTIINNCDHILYLAGHDPETADYISRYIDKTSNTVLTLPRNSAVLITDGEKPRIVAKLKPYSVDIQTLVKEAQKESKQQNNHAMGDVGND